MTHAVRGLGLVSCLVLVSTLAASCLAQSDRQADAAATSTAAYVYIQIQGPEGSVYGFRASSNGHLSAIPGSPFKPAGEIVGATPTKFFTLGEDLIHSYGIASDGAIESQLSQVPFGDYDKQCGAQQSGSGGAVLDHTGKYIYVDFGCAAGDELQTYLIHADGTFTYDGDADLPQCFCGYGLPSILGNESFAYADDISGHAAAPIGFRRESSGTLQLMQFNEKDPPLDGHDYFSVEGPDASPTGNYVILQLYPDGGEPVQLASYTVDAEGNISTTNTLSNMPTSANDQPLTTFSPSGDLFVAYSGYSGGTPNTPQRIEIYKFNGAAPLTLWRTLLSGVDVRQVAFDRSGHLYAISDEGRLYVFTVTSTSVTETSSIGIGSPFEMVVISE
jgi:hypothetical protein